MQVRRESIGVIGALQAFPLRLATRRVEALGGRLHRGVTRGTTMVVLGRTLLERCSETEIERKIAQAGCGPKLLSENGFLRLLGNLSAAATAETSRLTMLDQYGLDPHAFDMLAAFDAFENDREPFSFRDLILARKYAGLIKGGAGWSAIARSIHQFGPVSSVTALSLHALSPGRIVSQDRHSLSEVGGQRLLALPEASDEAEDYFGLAETAEQAGLFAEAATLYEHCTSIDPTDATSAFNLGNCLRAIEDHAGAALAYVTAIKRDPLFVEAWFNYGGLLRDGGKLDAARQHLARAVELDPAYADAVYNLAALDFDRGDLVPASAGWRRYLDLDPTSEWSRRARAGIAVAEQAMRKSAS